MRNVVLKGVTNGLALSFGLYALAYAPHLGAWLAHLIIHPSHEVYLNMR